MRRRLSSILRLLTPHGPHLRAPPSPFTPTQYLVVSLSLSLTVTVTVAARYRLSTTPPTVVPVSRPSTSSAAHSVASR